jgi:hypothetical protein
MAQPIAGRYQRKRSVARKLKKKIVWEEGRNLRYFNHRAGQKENGARGRSSR